jgi:hypothetical protein
MLIRLEKTLLRIYGQHRRSRYASQPLLDKLLKGGYYLAEVAKLPEGYPLANCSFSELGGDVIGQLKNHNSAKVAQHDEVSLPAQDYSP